MSSPHATGMPVRMPREKSETISAVGPEKGDLPGSGGLAPLDSRRPKERSLRSA